MYYTDIARKASEAVRISWIFRDSRIAERDENDNWVILGYFFKWDLLWRPDSPHGERYMKSCINRMAEAIESFVDFPVSVGKRDYKKISVYPSGCYEDRILLYIPKESLNAKQLSEKSSWGM